MYGSHILAIIALLQDLLSILIICCTSQVQSRFEVDIKQLPEQIDTSTYSMFLYIELRSFDGYLFGNDLCSFYLKRLSKTLNDGTL